MHDTRRTFLSLAGAVAVSGLESTNLTAQKPASLPVSPAVQAFALSQAKIFASNSAAGTLNAEDYHNLANAWTLLMAQIAESGGAPQVEQLMRQQIQKGPLSHAELLKLLGQSQPVLGVTFPSAMCERFIGIYNANFPQLANSFVSLDQITKLTTQYLQGLAKTASPFQRVQVGDTCSLGGMILSIAALSLTIAAALNPFSLAIAIAGLSLGVVSVGFAVYCA